MPEEQKNVAAPPETAAENGTGTNSPTKSPVSKGKMALAKVTLLDGTVRDFYIDVSCRRVYCTRDINKRYSCHNLYVKYRFVTEKGERARTS